MRTERVARKRALLFALTAVTACAGETTPEPPSGVAGVFSSSIRVPTVRPARALAALESTFALAFEVDDRAAVYGGEPFAELGATSTGPGPRAVCAGDLDGDGRPELATADTTGARVTVLWWDGERFTGTASAATDRPPVHVTAADLDGDGTAELAVTVGLTPEDAALQIFRVTGGTLAAIGPPSPIAGAIAAAAGDLDGDAADELAVVLGASARVGLHELDPSGGLKALAVLDVCAEPFAARIGAAGGGANGVAVACRSGGVDLLLRGEERVHLAGATRAYDVELGDFDGDGAPDVAAADVAEHRVTVWYGLSGGAPVSHDVGRGPIALRSIDADDDGDRDLVVLTFEARAVEVLVNGRGDRGPPGGG